MILNQAVDDACRQAQGHCDWGDNRWDLVVFAIESVYLRLADDIHSRRLSIPSVPEDLQ